MLVQLGSSPPLDAEVAPETTSIPTEDRPLGKRGNLSS